MSSNYGVPGYENPYLIKIQTDGVNKIKNMIKKTHPTVELKKYEILQQIIDQCQKYEDQMKGKKNQIKSLQRKIVRCETHLETLKNEKKRKLQNLIIKDFETQLHNFDQEHIRLENKIRGLELIFEENIKRVRNYDKYQYYLGKGTEEQRQWFSAGLDMKNDEEIHGVKIENDKEKPKAKIENGKKKTTSFLSKFFGLKNDHKNDAKNENDKEKPMTYQR